MRIDRQHDSDDHHISEQGCNTINVDYAICNDGTLSELSDAAWALLDDLGPRVTWKDSYKPDHNI